MINVNSRINGERMYVPIFLSSSMSGGWTETMLSGREAMEGVAEAAHHAITICDTARMGVPRR